MSVATGKSRARRPETGGRRRAWVAALAPPAAWLAHLGVVYGVEEVVCRTALRGSSVLGLTLVEALTIAATVVALAVTLAGGVLGYRVWAATGRADVDVDPPLGRDAFLGLAGVLLGALFAATIALEGAPAAFLAPCA